ncbi:hypothetical protein D7B24_007383 [Verticillium nonalfalfae]|uniref:Zinc finger C2H2 LYAR-type domain-containing protein n=1 Tax=Verticillium nonalfalfae TaxID=1051616 RepID=A0A3M9Y9W6_9PEZI|nr:uncharacterized protein D7B24_007383 [Verticillium nonalfalfae]RNJ56328.1 hypothetical protein D7B24_007383 [Verticillium nonalfalfae]
MVYFPGLEYRAHTSCMTEEQKYQGALYKPKKQKHNNNQNNQQVAMSQQPYVEDVPEFAGYEYDGHSDDAKTPVDLPEAPTPPPADEGPVNVFDFLDPSATPNASTLQLGPLGERHINEETQLVRYEAEASAYLDPSGAPADEDPEAPYQYGTGPIPGAFETPAPRGDRKKKDGSDTKKDKKRKRLHLDTDQIMADAPPVLHSGLTGGLNRMMRPAFPPSPDYSGGDVAEAPVSPLKKKKPSKHSKHGKRSEGSIGSNLMGLLSSSKTKTKKRKVSSSSTRKSSRRTDSDKATKLIEYRPRSSGDDKEGANAEGQMVVFRPRGDLLLSYVDKGPDSDRGYSMKKALRHFHRERDNSSDSLGKTIEEKELWRSLRMRKNDRGEIVLFGL